MSTGNEILLAHAALDGELGAAGMLDFEKTTWFAGGEAGC